MHEKLSNEDLELINSNDGLIALLSQKQIDIQSVLDFLKYKKELELLQTELIDLQLDIVKNKRRVAIIFEGRDAAGKGDAIKRFRKHCNPRTLKVVSFPKISEEDKSQWYFKRYVEALPSPGEFVLFDRSWYSRAVVEPVNGFCTQQEYQLFMNQVNEFEKLLIEDNIEIIKLWFSVNRESQKKRLAEREQNPLEKWMISPLDKKAQELWDEYTKYKEIMFKKTDTPLSPWIIVKSITRKISRLESLRYVLNKLNYEGKGNTGVNLNLDPKLCGPLTNFTKAST